MATMSPAQLAQQRNRDTAGQYRERQRDLPQRVSLEPSIDDHGPASVDDWGAVDSDGWNAEGLRILHTPDGQSVLQFDLEGPSVDRAAIASHLNLDVEEVQRIYDDAETHEDTDTLDWLDGARHVVDTAHATLDAGYDPSTVYDFGSTQDQVRVLPAASDRDSARAAVAGELARLHTLYQSETFTNRLADALDLYSLTHSVPQSIMDAQKEANHGWHR